MLKKGQICEGYVERVEFPNKGIVITEENEQVVVKNAVLGQTVSFQVNKWKHDRAEGRLLNVLKRGSEERTEGLCPHTGICGGCTYQCLPYEKQLSMKESQVKQILDEVIVGDYQFEGIQGSPLERGYRNKMEFSFGDAVKNGPLELGLHRRNSMYDVESVVGCQIVDEDYRAILSGVLEYFRAKGTPFYRKNTHIGVLRHLLVRKAAKTGEILVALVTSSQEELQLEDFVKMLLAIPCKGTLVGILQIINDSVADIVQSDETRILYGRDYIMEELLGLQFKISVFSFFQTNSLGAEVLYRQVREYIGETKDKCVFDLYSGTGTIAQIVAPVARKVTGVEIIAEAVEAAKVNAAWNGLHNCEFLAG
ncbi:MAG: 23S rRNA (uracil(1939)-C(5))-methyltransferase RlmD, partial [Lachnospiraceae bacterium]